MISPVISVDLKVTGLSKFLSDIKSAELALTRLSTSAITVSTSITSATASLSSFHRTTSSVVSALSTVSSTSHTTVSSLTALNSSLGSITTALTALSTSASHTGTALSSLHTTIPVASTRLLDFGNASNALGGMLGSLKGGLGNIHEAFVTVGNVVLGWAETIGKVATGAVAALIASMGALTAAAINTAISYEDAFAGVSKTVDGMADDFGKLTKIGEEIYEQLKQLSRRTPISFEDLAAYAELGGSLGIAGSQIIDFTETVGKLAVTTDLTGEKAATGLATIANIYGTRVEDMAEKTKKMGSVLVDLGNKTAATETSILKLSQMLANATRLVGISEKDLFAISAAASSVGIAPEAGASAISSILMKINASVVQSDWLLKDFASVARMTADQFAEAWRSDPTQTFLDFLDGIMDKGEKAQIVLKKLDIKGIRELRSALSLAGGLQLFDDSVTWGRQEWEEVDALSKEAMIRFKTTANVLQLVKNNFVDLGNTIGEAFLPRINQLLTSLFPIFDAFGKKLPYALTLFKGGIRSTLSEFINIDTIIGNTSKSITKAVENFNLAKSLRSTGLFNVREEQNTLPFYLSEEAIIKKKMAGDNFIIPLKITLSGESKRLLDNLKTLGGLLAKQFGFTIIAPSSVSLLGTVNSVLESIIVNFDNIVTVVNGLKNMAMISTIVAIVTALANPINLAILAIGSLAIAWQTNFMGIQDIANSTIPSIISHWEGLVSFFDSSVTTLSNLFSQFVTFVTPAVNVLYAVGQTVIQFLTPMFTSLGNGFLQFFDALSPIQDALGSLFKTIIDGMPALSWVAGIVGGALLLGIRLLGEGLALALPYIGEFISLIGTSFIYAIEGAVNVLTGFAQVFRWVFTGDLPNLINGFSNIIDGFSNMFLIQFVRATSTIGSALYDAFVNGFTEVNSYLSDWGSKLFTSMPGAIDNAVKFFSDMIDVIKGVFGIKSPSSVFSDIGVNIIQGLINGLSSMKDVLFDLVGGLFNPQGWLSGLFSGGEEQGAATQKINVDTSDLIDSMTNVTLFTDSLESMTSVIDNKVVNSFVTLSGILDSFNTGIELHYTLLSQYVIPAIENFGQTWQNTASNLNFSISQMDIMLQYLRDMISYIERINSLSISVPTPPPSGTQGNVPSSTGGGQNYSAMSMAPVRALSNTSQTFHNETQNNYSLNITGTGRVIQDAQFSFTLLKQLAR